LDDINSHGHFPLNDILLIVLYYTIFSNYFLPYPIGGNNRIVIVLMGMYPFNLRGILVRIQKSPKTYKSLISLFTPIDALFIAKN